MRFCRQNSLEALCLNVIVGNIELYYQHNESVERYNKFLQRHYSDRIYNLLKKKGMLEEEFLYWLISPFWNDIVIRKIHSLSKFVPKLRLCGETINSICLENSSATVEILSAAVCCLPNVKSLNLSSTNCSDELLVLIRKMCSTLNNLNLYECNITDMGMKNLCYVNHEKVGFESLKVLNIESTHVKTAGVAYILKNLNLQVLMYHDIATIMYYLYQSSIDEPCADIKIHDFTVLDFFMNISSVSLTSILKAWTALCPYVERLTILEGMTQEGIDLCLKFQKLKSLKIIEIPHVEETVLSHFLELSGDRLTNLSLHNTIVSVEVIARSCHNLQKLHLVNITYEDFNEADVKTGLHYLNNITILKVKNSSLCENTTHKSIYLLLNSCNNVEYLTVNFVKDLSEKFIDVITNMSNLVKARFMFTDIKEHSVKQLFACENILELWFDGCPYLKTHENSEIFKLINQSNHGNTLSWQIEYNEMEDE